MSNTTSPVQVSYDGEIDVYVVTCEQHSRREVFDGVHAAERFRRGHEAAVSHWYPTATPEPLYIIRVCKVNTTTSLVQPDGATLDEVTASAEHYVSRGYSVELLVSYNAGKTARVFRTWEA